MTSIRVHQTLHGYQEGHRLLASSLELVPEARREMLLLSDAAGEGAPNGFDGFISGYPLAQSGLYALARTWAAPEVRRAGCVWTHTLLIDFSDLAGLQTFEQITLLEGAWTRPSAPDKSDQGNLEFYRHPLRLHLETESLKRPLFLPKAAILDAVLASLYSPEGAEEPGSPPANTPVFLAAQDSRQWEHLAWALWLQLWPRMRRQFAFCTGATSARRVENRSFDLQIAPTSVQATLRRDESQAHFIGFVAPQTNAAPQKAEQEQDWLSLLRRDIETPLLPLRHFLRVFGAEVGDDRAEVGRLTDLFATKEDLEAQKTVSPALLEPLLERLARYYPRSNQAKTLKTTLFGSPSPHGWLKVDERVTLESLGTTAFWKMLPASTFALENRAAELWINRQDDAEKLFSVLVQPGANALAERELSGFARAFKVEDAARILGTHWTLASLFVREHPALATSPALWRGPQDLRRELLDVLSEASLSPQQCEELGAALFASGAAEVVEDATRRLGNSIPRGAFGAWDKATPIPNEPVVPQAWQKLFAGQEEMLLDWLRNHVESETALDRVAALIPLLTPDSGAVRAFPASLWIDLAKKVGASLSGKTKGEVLAFVLALGLDDIAGRGAEIIALTFEGVHEAQKRTQLSYEAWQCLESRVPKLEHSHWDRCERLRRALLEAFATRSWPETLFLEAIQRHDTLIHILRSGAATPESKAFLKQLRKKARTGYLNANPWQIELLKEKKGVVGFIESWLD